MPKFILIRHGESAWNSEGRIQGSLDPELSPRGRRQAGLLASHLKIHLPRSIAAIYSSPLRRAAQTAEEIGRAFRLPVIHDHDLREMSLGAWEGKTIAEIETSTPGYYEQWMEDPLTYPAPGGEDLHAFERRIAATFQRMQQAHAGANLIVVSHGGVIRTLLCFALGLDLRHLFRFKQNTSAVSQIKLDGRAWQVLLVNDTCHLRGGPVGVTGQEALAEDRTIRNPVC